MTHVIVYNATDGTICRDVAGDIDPGSVACDSGQAKLVFESIVDTAGKVVDVDTEEVVSAPDVDARTRRQRVRELADVQAKIERLEGEIAAGNVPGRDADAAIDAVLSDWEAQRDELRTYLG